MQEKENTGERINNGNCSHIDCLGMPGVLSYQGLKLANFLEIELTGLSGVISSVSDSNFRNQLKDIVARSYGIFHEMGKLYQELGMSFLYQQTKKLVGSYGLIFVMIFEKLEQQQQSYNKQKKPISDEGQSSKAFQTLDSKQIDKQQVIQQKHTIQKQNPQCKKMGGVSLYLETYSRNIDYDIQLIRKIKEKQEMQKRNAMQRQALQADKQGRIEYESRLKESILTELNDNQYQKDEIYAQLLARQKYINQKLKGIAALDQIDQVVELFRESESQAKQFLKQIHFQEDFYNSLEGFNTFQKECRLKYDHNAVCLKEKVKYLLASISQKLEQEQQNKKQVLKNKKDKHVKWRIDCETQTNDDCDEEKKRLQLRIVQQQKINQLSQQLYRQLKQSERKNSGHIQREASQKDLKLIKMSEDMAAKNKKLLKLDKKMRMLLSKNKNKDCLTLSYFEGLSQQQKMNLIQQFQEQGLLSAPLQQDKQLQQTPNNIQQNINEQISGISAKDGVIAEDEENLKMNIRIKLPTSSRTNNIKHNIRRNKSNNVQNMLRRNDSRIKTSPVQGFTGSNNARASLLKKKNHLRRPLTEQDEQSGSYKQQPIKADAKFTQGIDYIVEGHEIDKFACNRQKLHTNTKLIHETQQQASINNTLKTVPQLLEDYQTNPNQFSSSQRHNFYPNQQLSQLHNYDSMQASTSDISKQHRFYGQGNDKHEGLSTNLILQKVQYNSINTYQRAKQPTCQETQCNVQQFEKLDNSAVSPHEQQFNSKRPTVDGIVSGVFNQQVCSNLNKQFDKQEEVEINKQKFSLNKKFKGFAKNVKLFNGVKTENTHQKSERTVNSLNIEKRLNKTSGFNIPPQNPKKSAQMHILSQLYKQFGDSETRNIAQRAINLQQFKQKIQKTHYNKCGINCPHLNRYIQIFLKIIEWEGKRKRKQIECPVIDLHDNINQSDSTGIRRYAGIKRLPNGAGKLYLKV